MSQPAINNQSHLFFIEPSKNKYLPPWFLDLVTRDEAEKVLSRSEGNILMRTHSSFDSTGKYVITHRKETACFRHYLLLNTPDGFLLDIDHKNNRPVKCLSEAMDLFVKLVGRSAKPISSGLSSDYLMPNDCSDLEKIDQTIGCVPITLGSSAGPLLTCDDYVNVPQASAMGQLNRDPHHSYVNAQQLSHAQDTQSDGSGFRSPPWTKDVSPNFPPPSPKWT